MVSLPAAPDGFSHDAAPENATASTTETSALSSARALLVTNRHITNLRQTHGKRERARGWEGHSGEDKHSRRYNNNQNEREQFTLQSQIKVDA